MRQGSGQSRSSAIEFVIHDANQIVRHLAGDFTSIADAADGRVVIDSYCPRGRRGGQQKYSGLAIEAALALRLVFHLPVRKVEGFLGSMFDLINIQLDVPDHTTLSRRGRHLNVCLQSLPASGPIDLIVDSTGLTIVGKGEWAAAKHGGQGIQGWIKLHISTDSAGVIVAQILTNSNGDDATTGVALLFSVAQDINTVIADAVYVTLPFYNAASDRETCVVVPPT